MLIDNTGRCGDGNCYNNYMHLQMMHDGEYVYFKMTVDVEQLENWFNDSTDAWHDDSVELYFDAGYDRLDSYGDCHYQRIFRLRELIANPTTDGFYSAVVCRRTMSPAIDTRTTSPTPTSNSTRSASSFHPL